MDSQLVLSVLSNQIDALSVLERNDPETLRAYHCLTTTRSERDGFDAVFVHIRGGNRPIMADAQEAIRGLLRKHACIYQIETVIPEAERDGWPLAYALAWISVAGGDSVMPPWVIQRTGKPLSNATIATTLRAVREFFRWAAVQHGYKKAIGIGDWRYFKHALKDARAAQASTPRPVLSVLRDLFGFDREISAQSLEAMRAAEIESCRSVSVNPFLSYTPQVLIALLRLLVCSILKWKTRRWPPPPAHPQSPMLDTPRKFVYFEIECGVKYEVSVAAVFSFSRV